MSERASNETNYIFITGGVVSSLGKGIAAAAIGSLLLDHGYRVRICKLDPYLNIDPGTMSPFEHGEVFVTDDGAETDLDIGHYERFTNENCSRIDNTTTGRIYQTLIEKERSGNHFLGKTVQVIPHVTNEIGAFITANNEGKDFLIAEIGGTVGDIESLPFIEAIRQIGNDKHGKVMFVHLTLVPWLSAAEELKTKPTQHSVKELLSLGIQPHMLLCRISHPLPAGQRQKIARFCNVPSERVFEAPDVASIYSVPLLYRQQGVDKQILEHFGMQANPTDLAGWQQIVENHLAPSGGEVVIGMIGKYVDHGDAYKSLREALTHAAIAKDIRVRTIAIDSETIEGGEAAGNAQIAQCHAILVPGGFGGRGIEGKMQAARYARMHKIPYLGICYGMQLAVIEFARNVAGITDATSEEYIEDLHRTMQQDATGTVKLDTAYATGTAMVIRLQNWLRENNIDWQTGDSLRLGGSMRLGAFPCKFAPDSLIQRIYAADSCRERHRHRYELSTKHLSQLAEHGLRVSGTSFDGTLPEVIELADHPWFVGVQYHPEFLSRPFRPHPLFVSFIEAALCQRPPK